MFNYDVIQSSQVDSLKCGIYNIKMCSRKLKRKEKVIHILIKVKAPCMLSADLCTEWKDMNILHFLNIPTICCSILTISNKFEFNLTETETFI